MIIAAKVIHKPRINRTCVVCEQEIGSAPTLQLYGMGEVGDPPYRLYFCLPCAETLPVKEAKIDRALAAHAAKYERRRRMREIAQEIARALNRELRFPTDGQLAYYQGLADEYAGLEALEKEVLAPAPRLSIN